MFDVRELAGRVREVAECDLSSLGDDELLAATVAVVGVASQVEVAGARLLAEVAARGLTDRRFGSTVAGWVAGQANVDRRGVARRLRLGRRLRRLPQVEAAVAAGGLSVDHGSALADHGANPRVGDEVEASQAAWVELAAATPYRVPSPHRPRPHPHPTRRRRSARCRPAGARSEPGRTGRCRTGRGAVD